MTRIAILGGGISGLTAAYELEKARRAGAPMDWHLYEATNRLGGTLETTRIATPEGEYILEGGPDGWVTEKPWARELAVELGLERELIHSNDLTRRTYIVLDGQLQAIPDRMRLMVPEDLETLEGSPLFSSTAKQAYQSEPARAAELKTSSPLIDPASDESVASFVLRHFGEEVLTRLAAPLLSGVFGGDVHKLSVRAVMPQFVRMERENGSLILALQQARRERGETSQPSIFTSLKRGLGSLIEALVSALPSERIHLDSEVTRVARTTRNYEVSYGPRLLSDGTRCRIADHVLFATCLGTTARLLGSVEGLPGDIVSYLPHQASSAILVSFTWPGEHAGQFATPPGFGFLVPPAAPSSQREPEQSNRRVAGLVGSPAGDVQLLACTLVDQKFPHRAPAGARVLRAFFGSGSAEQLSNSSDERIADAALAQLQGILGPLPTPQHTSVRRWPRSLPQYEVGHFDRMAQLDALVAQIPGLILLGNSYRGVGIPDLIRDARAAARVLVDRSL